MISIDIKKGDIIYADFGSIIGSEQGGIRPALVVQNDIGNRFSPTTIVVPLTSRMNKNNLPTHMFIDTTESGLPKPSVALFEQIRVIDKSRIKGKIGSIRSKWFNYIDQFLMISFGVNPSAQRNVCA